MPSMDEKTQNQSIQASVNEFRNNKICVQNLKKAINLLEYI